MLIVVRSTKYSCTFVTALYKILHDNHYFAISLIAYIFVIMFLIISVVPDSFNVQSIVGRRS